MKKLIIILASLIVVTGRGEKQPSYWYISALILTVAFCTAMAHAIIQAGNTKTGYSILLLTGLWIGGVIDSFSVKPVSGEDDINSV